MGLLKSSIALLTMVAAVGGLPKSSSASQDASFFVAPLVNSGGALYKASLRTGELELLTRFPPTDAAFRAALAARPGRDEVFEFIANRINVVNVNTDESRSMVLQAVEHWRDTARFSADGKLVYAIAKIKEKAGISGVVIDPEGGRILKLIENTIDTAPDRAVLTPGGDIYYAVRGGVARESVHNEESRTVYFYEGAEQVITKDVLWREGNVYVLSYEGEDTGLFGLTNEVLVREGRARGVPFHNNGANGKWYFFDRDTETVSSLDRCEPSYTASLSELFGKERLKPYTGDVRTKAGSPYRYILDDKHMYEGPIKFTDVYLSPDGAFSIFVHDIGIRWPSFLVLRDNKANTWGEVISLDEMGGGLTNIVFGDATQ